MKNIIKERLEEMELKKNLNDTFVKEAVFFSDVDKLMYWSYADLGKHEY